MTSKRTWRWATAGLATTTLLLGTVGGAAAQDVPGLPDLPGLPGDDEDDDGADDGADDTSGIPDAGIGGFSAFANAAGLQVGVGLPAELAEPLAPVFEGLGIDGSTNAIEIDFAQTTAQLQRAAEGEDVGGLGQALATNLLLGSEAAGAPGSCTGGETVDLPDEDTPVLTLTVVGIDCGQDDERAFATATVAGAAINLGNLIDLAGAEALRDGLDQVLEPVNEQLLGAINDACGDILDPINDGLGQLPVLDLPATVDVCDAVELELENVLDVEIPLLDVTALTSDTEVVRDEDTVTATATSGLADLSLGGLLCIEGSDPGAPLEFASTATSDGSTGAASTSTTEATVRLCGNSPLLQIVDVETLLNSIEIAGQGAGDLLGEALDPVEEGLEEALATLLVDTENSLRTYTDTAEEGAGASAVAGLQLLDVALFRGIEPLADTPLGEVSVSILAMDTAAGVNAQPAGEAPAPPADPDPAPDPDPETPDAPAPPEGDLPRTGAGVGAVLGLGALAAAAALRRGRRDEL